jgi:hypothetical protein
MSLGVCLTAKECKRSDPAALFCTSLVKDNISYEKIRRFNGDPSIRDEQEIPGLVRVVLCRLTDGVGKSRSEEKFWVDFRIALVEFYLTGGLCEIRFEWAEFVC